MDQASNSTSKKYEALAKAWIKASTDPVHGNYHKTKIIWHTIQDYFVGLQPI